MKSYFTLIIPLLVISTHTAQAQDCEDTPEGRICRVQQEIVGGTEVDVHTQGQLGLVTVNGGCSGTLLNQFWVLTARHCVTTTAEISDPLRPPDQVTVTATWAPPGHVGRATMIWDFAVNRGAALPNFDMVLIFLGAADFGPVARQRIYSIALDQGNGSVVLSGRLRPTDTVTQYGRGFSTFASGIFGTASAVPAAGAGTYRSARFAPSDITEVDYELVMNAGSQVGHGGDSGGPSIVTVDNVGVGIAGVQSTCTPTGYISGAPRRWPWATGIAACQYAATEAVLSELTSAIRETPAACQAQARGCGVIEASRLIMK